MTSTQVFPLTRVEARNFAEIAYYVFHGFRAEYDQRNNRVYMVRGNPHGESFVSLQLRPGSGRHGRLIRLTTPEENRRLVDRQTRARDWIKRRLVHPCYPKPTKR